MPNHHNSMQILNKFVQKYRTKKSFEIFLGRCTFFQDGDVSE